MNKLLNNKKYNIKSLYNGLKIATYSDKNFKSIIVSIFIKVGSKDENKSNQGISHFLEHMCFKGTKKYTSPKQISDLFNKLGCTYNAVTGLEYTLSYAMGHYHDIYKILDIMLDIYKNSVIIEKDIILEKKVINEEIGSYEDNEDDILLRMVYRTLYGNNPAGRRILGTKESLEKLKKKNLENFRNNYYCPNNTIIVVSGNITNESNICKYISNWGNDFNKSLIGGKKKKSCLPKYCPTIKTMKRRNIPKRKQVIDNQKKVNYMFRKMDNKQVHFLLALRTFNMYDKNHVILIVLSEILGSGDTSSKLFREIREKLGLAYYINCYNTIYSDHGFLAIETTVDKNDYLKVIEKMISIFKGMKNNLVTDDELEIAKKRLIVQYSLNLETPSDYMTYIGEQELYKGKIKLKDKIEKIKKVTKNDILKISNKIFSKKKLNFCIIGKKANKKEILKILNNL